MSSSKKQKYPIAINIFPTLDYLELVQLDEATGEIQTATSMPCSFDPTTRQIQDLDILSQTIRDLFSANHVPSNAQVVIVLPSFFTREIDFHEDFSKEELKMALISEAERFHVFKNQEPQVDWFKMPQNKYLYSAFPKSEIEKLSMTFQELRIPVKAIELNYCAILRGLLATGTLSPEDVSARERWAMMVISDGNFFIGLMEGTDFLKITDTPLSQNALSEDMLDEIEGDYRLFSSEENFSKLVLINNSTKLDTDSLLSKLNITLPVASIDQNISTLASRGMPNAPFPCSLEGIGAVFYTQLSDLPSLDFKLDSAGVEEIAELKDKIFKVGLAISIVVFLLCLVFWGIMEGLVWMKDEEIHSKTQVASTGEQLPSGLSNYAEVQRKLFVKKTVDQNILANDAVVHIGKAMQSGLWLDKLEITVPVKEDPQTPNDPISLHIEGSSLQSELISQLNAELKKSLKRDDITVPVVSEPQTIGDSTFWRWTMESAAPTTDSNGQPPVGGGQH